MSAETCPRCRRDITDEDGCADECPPGAPWCGFDHAYLCDGCWDFLHGGSTSDPACLTLPLEVKP